VRYILAVIVGAMIGSGGAWAVTSSQQPATHLDVVKIESQLKDLQREVYSLCLSVQSSPPTHLCYAPR